MMKKFKQELARVFDDNLRTRQWQNWVDYAIIGLIIISTVEVFLSTFDSVANRYGDWLRAVDLFTTVFFTIEVTLRIWCADIIDPKYKGFWGRVRYCFSFYGLIDILSTYTFYIARLISKDGASAVADLPVQEVASPSPPAQPAKELAFGPHRDLADGWQVAFEVPEEQKVVIEYNAKRNAQVFRIEHDAAHTVRFTKHLSLRPRPKRLYWRVELADGRRGGAVTNFQFSTHLVFSDEKGALQPRVDGSGKRSANKDCAVPESATDAVLAIDCLCSGKHDLVVPHFADHPPVEK